MRKEEVQRLRATLTQEFLLTQNQTGLDLLAWYCDSTGSWAKQLRKIDTYDEAKASVRTAAHAPNALASRLVRAFDACVALVHDRGIDVSVERDALATMGPRRDVLEEVAARASSARETLNSRDGWTFLRRAV
jgi:hypothetical protein